MSGLGDCGSLPLDSKKQRIRSASSESINLDRGEAMNIVDGVSSSSTARGEEEQVNVNLVTTSENVKGLDTDSVLNQGQ